MYHSRGTKPKGYGTQARQKGTETRGVREGKSQERNGEIQRQIPKAQAKMKQDKREKATDQSNASRQQ